MKNRRLDFVWEKEIDSQGHHLNRYSFDAVVRKNEICAQSD